jgi:crotonobetainyl-CoA:carnitine CoA-transferase CaiB-like acyl-CoA transferase
VLDLTQVLAGPFATMLLADLGADVVKVEPRAGDMARAFGPFLTDDVEHFFGGYFASINRNKRSITLDLKHPAGVQALKRMVPQVDVLIENFRGGVMEQLGCGYEELSSLNPKLVYACVRGYGDHRTGPSLCQDWPAFDLMAQAAGGLMGITGDDAANPRKAGPGVGDLVPGMLVALGILAAARHAEMSGQGQLVDVAMYDAVVALCERVVYQYSYQGSSPEPEGNNHPILCPYGAFNALDGVVTIAAPTDAMWTKLVRLIDAPAAGRDPRFVTPAARQAHRSEVNSLIESWTSRLTKKEIVAALGREIPCAGVNTARDIFEDAHIAARQMVVPIDHPGSQTGGSIAGLPIKFTETPGSIERRAPLLGEHTEQILREFGFSSAEVRDLRTEATVN